MAIDLINLKVEPRTNFGKGASRQARRNAQIPAVIYGHGTEPRHVLLPEHDAFLALRNPNQLVNIIEGDVEEMALPKDIQRNVLKEKIDHVDFVIVRRGEKVVVDVWVEVEGEAAPETAFNLALTSVPVEADALDLPESVTINIDGREVGDHVLAKDVILPEGTTIQLEDDEVVATIDEIVEQDLGEDVAPEEPSDAEIAEAEAAGESAEDSDEE